MPKIYIEDINITGFKSFSEKTGMSFKPGIGVIVGNNGVGKSNILDAIVWALGENDLERIRCYEHDELYFAGSKEYSPEPGADGCYFTRQPNRGGHRGDPARQPGSQGSSAVRR